MGTSGASFCLMPRHLDGADSSGRDRNVRLTQRGHLKAFLDSCRAARSACLHRQVHSCTLDYHLEPVSLTGKINLLPGTDPASASALAKPTTRRVFFLFLLGVRGVWVPTASLGSCCNSWEGSCEYNGEEAAPGKLAPWHLTQKRHWKRGRLQSCTSTTG